MINSKKDLFDMVNIISNHRPFDPGKIESLTDHKLENIKPESNEYFLIYRSLKDNVQRNDNLSIELRVPTSKSSCRDGMIVINLEPVNCIDQDDVVNEYGLGEPNPPHPNMPEEEALFYLS